MGAADIGDQAVVRAAHLHELGNVVGMVRPHLHDGDLGVGADREQGQRHSDVIEITFGRTHAVFSGEHGAYQVLRGSLAVGSGKAYHRQMSAAQVRAMPYRQLLQCGERVVHHFEPLMLRQFPAVSHGPRGPFLKSGQCIVVAVEILAFEREEYLSPGDFPAVGGHPAAAVQIY